MKKILILAIIGIMVFSLAACGGAKETETTAAPEATEETVPAEITDEEIAAPAIDITGCNTFTEIVDTKLEDGMGYAQVKIGDTEVLLVAASTFNNNLEEGERYDAAVEADIYCYDADGSIKYLDKVQSGGSANPLAIKDGKLYIGSHRSMKIVTVDPELGALVTEDEAGIKFDEEGNETYYRINAAGENEALEDDSLFTEYLSEYGDAEVIRFDVVSK